MHDESRTIKRSQAITLILIGTGAAALIAASQSRDCGRDDNGDPVSCRSGGGGAVASSGRTRSRSSFSFNSNPSRGGFGSTGSATSSGGSS